MSEHSRRLGNWGGLAAMAAALVVGPLQPGPAAQTVVPARISNDPTAGLGATAEWPWMVRECRFQQLIDPNELSDPNQLVVRRISFRFAAGEPGARAVPHRIDSLRIRIGVTDRTIANGDSVFAANLTRPLQTVVDARGVVFRSDAEVRTGASAWGGPFGELSFALPAPVTLTRPARGGSYVLDVEILGNTNDGLDPAYSDLFVAPNLVEPDDTTSGIGCDWGGGVRPEIRVGGTLAPGGSLDWEVTGLPPLAPVVLLFSPDVSDYRVHIAGTPRCWFYLGPTTTLVLDSGFANAVGSVDRPPRGGLPIPRDPRIRQRLLYAQAVSAAPRTTENPSGLSSSNYRTIKLGERARPTVGWVVASPSQAGAVTGSVSAVGSLALRLD